MVGTRRADSTGGIQSSQPHLSLSLEKSVDKVGGKSYSRRFTSIKNTLTGKQDQHLTHEQAKAILQKKVDSLVKELNSINPDSIFFNCASIPKVAHKIAECTRVLELVEKEEAKSNANMEMHPMSEQLSEIKTQLKED